MSGQRGRVANAASNDAASGLSRAIVFVLALTLKGRYFVRTFDDPLVLLESCRLLIANRLDCLYVVILALNPSVKTVTVLLELTLLHYCMMVCKHRLFL